MHSSSKLNKNIFIINGKPVKVIHILCGGIVLLLLTAVLVAVG